MNAKPCEVKRSSDELMINISDASEVRILLPSVLYAKFAMCYAMFVMLIWR